MTKDEALKLALKALYENTQYSMRGDPMAYQDERNDDTILLIQEALALPDTDMAYTIALQRAIEWHCDGKAVPPDVAEVCAYHAEMLNKAVAQPEMRKATREEKISNPGVYEVSVQPEQEPLEYWNAVEGWVKIDEVREHFDSVGCGTIYKTAGEGREPLYTTPPQRPWIGLTDDELFDCWESAMNGNVYTKIRVYSAIESKLKSKNNG